MYGVVIEAPRAPTQQIFDEVQGRPSDNVGGMRTADPHPRSVTLCSPPCGRKPTSMSAVAVWPFRLTTTADALVRPLTTMPVALKNRSAASETEAVQKPWTATDMADSSRRPKGPEPAVR